MASSCDCMYPGTRVAVVSAQSTWSSRVDDPYACTEVIDFCFSSPFIYSWLSDISTAVGRIWADTLQTYLELEATGTIWWADVQQVPDKAKLIIDWKTIEGREAFQASPPLTSLKSLWASVTQVPPQSAVYRLSLNPGARKAGFSSSYGAVSVLLTFRFPDNFVPSSTFNTWEETSDAFAQCIMTDPGSVVTSAWCCGMEINNTACCVAFSHASREKMLALLEQEKPRRLLQTLRTSCVQSSIDFLNTRIYEYGWCGTVERRFPHAPHLEVMFAHARKLENPGTG